MNTTTTSPSAISPFAAYANARSPRKFDGQLLKFTKGEYLVGPDNVVLTVGTRVVALMDTVAIGWERWWEGGPPRRRLHSAGAPRAGRPRLKLLGSGQRRERAGSVAVHQFCRIPDPGIG
jgi:hypothetical protein